MSHQYRLVTQFGEHELVSCADSIESLADVVYRNLYSSPSGGTLIVVREGLPGLVRLHEFISCLITDSSFSYRMDGLAFNAFAETPAGRRLDVMMLYRWGETRWNNRPRRWWVRRYGDWNGEGPVPGTGKMRGGYHAYRRIATMNERRQAQKTDELDPGPRPVRSANNLPNSWDDIFIRRERNWKSQHKGRKSWDRR